MVNHRPRMMRAKYKQRVRKLFDAIAPSNDSNGQESVHGRFPKKITDFEELYDPATGGWRSASDKAKGMIDYGNAELEEGFIDYGTVELEVGRFWYAFTKLIRAKLVLETGTYFGYSTCCIANALRETDPSARVITIDPVHRTFLWKGTELENYIVHMPVLSQDSLDSLQGKTFDMLVLDSEHDYKTVMWELIHFERMLRPGGYILMHDSLYFDGVGAAVKQLYGVDGFEVVTMETPRRHGIELGRCPGITIVKKTKAAIQELSFDEKYKDWEVGDPLEPPFLYRD